MKFIHLAFFLFSMSFCTMAQVNKDSLKAIWENETLADSTRFNSIYTFYDVYMLSKPDTILDVADFHFDLADRKQNTEEKYFALNNKAQVYYLLGDSENSMLVLEQAAELCRENGFTAQLGQLYGNMASIYIVQRDYKKGIIQYTKALEILKAGNNREDEIFVKANLGNVYNQIGNYDLALEYFNEANDYYEEINNKELESDLWLKIANLNLAKKDYKTAISSAEKALTNFELNNNEYYKAEAFHVIATSNYELGNIDEARNYNEKSLDITEKISNQSNYLEGLTLQANINLINDVDLATQQAESLVKLIKPDFTHEHKRDIYNLLYKCYKAQGKLAKSLEMQEQFIIYNDSVQLEKKNFEVVREAVKTEFETKLIDNKLESKRKQQELESKQFRTNAFIIGVSLFLIAMLLLYLRSVKKKNLKIRKELLQELNILKKSSSNGVIVDSTKFELNKDILDKSIDRKLNETDWNVLNILLENPEITNKVIAEKAFMSIDGIGSSLRRMYEYFDIQETKYKKIALIKEAIKRCKESSTS